MESDRRVPLITKNIRRLQRLHAFHTEVPDINNLGKLLSLKQQLRALQTYGVLAQFLAQAFGVNRGRASKRPTSTSPLTFDI